MKRRVNSNLKSVVGKVSYRTNCQSFLGSLIFYPHQTQTTKLIERNSTIYVKLFVKSSNKPGWINKTVTNTHSTFFTNSLLNSTVLCERELASTKSKATAYTRQHFWGKKLVYKSNVDVMCTEYVSYPRHGLKNCIKFTSGKSLFHSWGIILYDLYFLPFPFFLFCKNEGIIHNEN